MRKTVRQVDSGPLPAATTYLVEQYWPGVTTEIFRSAAKRVRATAQAMARGGVPIRYLHSTMVPADEATFCVISATSLDLIEQLYAQAGVRFDRIIAAIEV
jgi:hypothetical protein